MRLSQRDAILYATSPNAGRSASLLREAQTRTGWGASIQCVLPVPPPDAAHPLTRARTVDLPALGEVAFGTALIPLSVTA
jgi:hypothetical protein